MARGSRLAGTATAVVLLAAGAWWLLIDRSDDYHDVDLQRPDDLTAAVDAIRRAVPPALDRASVPGAAVAVVADGSTLWSDGFGVTTTGGTEVTAETVFQVGSISKPVAAATILALADDGVLDLDEPVADLLSSWQALDAFPDPGSITLRRLLSHTAGMDTPGYLGVPADEPFPTTVESLEGATTGSPVRQSETPGEYSYSGGGYTIAQLVAEDVTGRPFGELAAQYVFEPLGMTSSGYDCTQLDELAPIAASGHDSDGEPTPRYRYPEAAAGGVCTNATDLAKFAAWLASDDPRSATMRQPADDADDIYGLGLEIYGGATVGHVGVNRGFNSRLVVNPDEGLGLLVITNGDRGAEIADEILSAWQEHS